MISSPTDLRDCVRSLQIVQDTLRDSRLGELNLAGENWWMLLRSDFFRPFTARRSTIYRKHFRTVSHTDPGTKLTAVLVPKAARPWHGQSLEPEVCLLTRHRRLLQPSAEGRQWAHFGFLRDHNEVVSGKLFNRIADAWLHETGRRTSALKLCPWEADADRHEFWKDAVWVCGSEPDHSEALWDASEEAVFRQAFAAVIALCEERSLPYFGDVESALLRIRRCLRLGKQWEIVFRHYRPKFLALSSFHTEDRQPVMLAAKRCRIPVCDIEHGFMGEYSPYARLDGVPEAAVDWFPAAFWCWGAPSATFLRSSLGKWGERRSVVGAWGSPWHTFVRQQPMLRYRRWLKGALFRSRHNHYVRRLLIVHQPDLQAQGEYPQLLPEHVWEVMAREGDDTLWMLRLHPRSRHLSAEYTAAFQERCIKNFEITDSSALPLEALRPIVDGVLTSFSTIALEFSTAGIPFYVIDDFGVATLADFIEPPFSFAANTLGRLNDALGQSSPRERPSETYYSRIREGSNLIKQVENQMKA